MGSRAAELLRSIGLVVDGPVAWGQPVRSRSPGVYVVELPAPLEKAPIDHNALRRWIERVPTLLLDGERPTPHQLADRLAAFWYPDQTVLYIGRTARSLGGRVAAYYGTPLGDPRPHAGGHWIKTLHDLPRCLVWWSETNAAEEYEDALLAAFERAVDPAVAERLHDPTVVVPFANLQTETGLRRDHGISGALLPDDGAREAADVETAPARQPARRPRTAPAAAGRRTKKTPPTVARAGPAVEPVHVSQAGLDQLRAELTELRSVERPAVVARIRAARELGDLSENADYEAARHEQSFLEGRVRTLETLIEHAALIEESVESEEVRVGSTVRVAVDGREERYTIVGRTETNPREGRISNASPLGRALLGKRPGDEVVVKLPVGETRYRVLEVG